MLSKTIKVSKEWTLFLDRDGVINKKIEKDYVKCWSEFIFIDQVLEALSYFTSIFGRIIVVTNQKGVGRGLMSETDLIKIHDKMKRKINENQGKIDKIYYCTSIKDTANCRKPNTGMGINAKNDFPNINFNKSIMVGDSDTDIEFAKQLGMRSVLLSSNSTKSQKIDIVCNSLFELTNLIISNGK